ncbi:MAG: hypothetical protein ACRDLT_06815 [Solirubrobacteraceae bacterium]
MLRTQVCIALALAGLLAPGSAVAHRAAGRGARASILAAAVHQGEISRRQAACQVVMISTVNRSYAMLAWPAKLSEACLEIAANGVVIEHQTGSSWHVVIAGSSFQCPIEAVPTPVARDLGVCH